MSQNIWLRRCRRVVGAGRRVNNPKCTSSNQYGQCSKEYGIDDQVEGMKPSAIRSPSKKEVVILNKYNDYRNTYWNISTINNDVHCFIHQVSLPTGLRCVFYSTSPIEVAVQDARSLLEYRPLLSIKTSPPVVATETRNTGVVITDLFHKVTVKTAINLHMCTTELEHSVFTSRDSRSNEKEWTPRLPRF